MTERKRYVWLDMVRILACYFVIMNHSHRLLFESGGITSGAVIFDGIIFSICKTAVPLFVMITGCLLLQRESSGRQTFRRILRIAVPLLALSVLYYILNNKESIGILDFVKKFVETPQAVYLWYLYMLIGLYLVAPYISKMVRHSSTAALVVFTLLFLVGPAAVRFAARYLGVTVSAFFFDAIFPVAIGYLVAGCAMSQIDLKPRYFWCAVGLFVVSVVVFLLSILMPYMDTGEVRYVYDSWQALPTVVSSLTLFYIFRYLFERARFNEKTAVILERISATTFGTYLIHYLVISKFYELGVFQAVFQVNPFVGVITLQICCFVVCSAVIFLLKKIPFVRWFL